MTMLTVAAANLGAAIHGLSDGETIFVDHETPCFWFAESPNGRRSLKISKRTMRLCHWGNPRTSPVFVLIDFEPQETRSVY